MECLICGNRGADSSDGLCSEACKMDSQLKKFRIVRVFFEGYPDKTIKRGMTLQEARAWCKDPETNSSTAKSKKAQSLLEKYGEWYDGFAEDI